MIFFSFLWSLFSANPVAAYAAVLSTLSFLMAVPLTIQSYRKSKREGGLLRVERAEAGSVIQEGWRYETVILTLINIGTPTVSITGYDVRVYVGRLNIFLRRNPVFYEGNGWRVLRGAKAFALSLGDGMSPPLPLNSGEPMRLEVHAPQLWPDRAPRRVIAVVKFSHSRRPLRIPIKPNDPWSYTDERGMAEAAQLLSSARVRRKTERGWEQI